MHITIPLAPVSRGKRGRDLETQVTSFIAWIENGDSAIAPQNIGLLADFKSISEDARWFMVLHNWVETLKVAVRDDVFKP